MMSSFHCDSFSSHLFAKRALQVNLNSGNADWIFPLQPAVEGWRIGATNIAEKGEKPDRRIVCIDAPLTADTHPIYAAWTQMLEDIWTPQIAELRGAMSGSVHGLEESLAGRDASSILQELLKVTHEVSRVFHRADDQQREVQEQQLNILADTVKAAGEHKQLELGREDQRFESIWQQIDRFKSMILENHKLLESYAKKIARNNFLGGTEQMAQILAEEQVDDFNNLISELARLQLGLLQEQIRGLEDHLSLDELSPKEQQFINVFSQQALPSLPNKQILQCEKGMPILLKTIRAAHQTRRKQMDLSLGRSGRHQGQLREAFEEVVRHSAEKGGVHANADLLERRIGKGFEKLKALALQTRQKAEALLTEIDVRKPVVIATTKMQDTLRVKLSEALEDGADVLTRAMLLGRKKEDCNPSERALIDSFKSMKRLSSLMNEIPSEGLERYGKILKNELRRVHKEVYDKYRTLKEDFESGRVKIIKDVKEKSRQETRVFRKVDWGELEWESLSPADYQEKLRQYVLTDLNNTVSRPLRAFKKALKEDFESGDPLSISSLHPEDEQRFLEDFGTMNEAFFDLLLDMLSYFLPAQERVLVGQIKDALKRGDHAKLSLYGQTFELRYDEEEYVAGSRDELPDQHYFLINGMPAVLYEARSKKDPSTKRAVSLLSVLHTLSQEMLKGSYDSEDVAAELMIVERKG